MYHIQHKLDGQWRLISVLSYTGYSAVISGKKWPSEITNDIAMEERLPGDTNDCSNVREVNTAWEITGSASLVYTKGKGDVEKIRSKFTQQSRDRAGIRTSVSWAIISIHPAQSLPTSVLLYTKTWTFIDSYKLLRSPDSFFVIVHSCYWNLNNHRVTSHTSWEVYGTVYVSSEGNSDQIFSEWLKTEDKDGQHWKTHVAFSNGLDSKHV